NQAHNMPTPAAEQGSPPNTNKSAVPAPFRASYSAGRWERISRLAHEKQQNKRRRRGRKQFLKCAEEGYEEKTPTGWPCPYARNWLSFVARSHSWRLSFLLPLRVSESGFERLIARSRTDR